MAKHLEVGELHEGRGLEIHVVGADLLAAFFYGVGDVFLLGALVGTQAPDEVVEGFFEPGCVLDMALLQNNCRVCPTWLQRLRRLPTRVY